MNTYNNVPNQNRPERTDSFLSLYLCAVGICLTLLPWLVNSSLGEQAVYYDDSEWAEWEAVEGGPPDKDPNKHADRINSKIDKLHGNLEKFMDTAIASDQIFDPNQIKYLKKEKARAKKANERFHKGGGFKKVGQKKNFNKKNQDKDEYDPNAFDDFEGTIEDLNDIVVEANMELANGNAAKAMFMFLEGSESADKCKEQLAVSLGLGISASVMRGLTIVAETAYNATDSAANQDFLGNNWSAGAAWLAGIAGTLDFITTGLEIADRWVATNLAAECLYQIDTTTMDNYKLTGDVNDTTMDIYGMVWSINDITEGTAQDVNDLAEKVIELNSELVRLNSELARLTQKIEDINDLINLRFSEQNRLLNERFDTAENLLNKPLGQRSDFPNK
jgi:uncharacterized coiled-coil protein SlyX